MLYWNDQSQSKLLATDDMKFNDPTLYKYY
jgi:hypothetical protein